MLYEMESSQLSKPFLGTERANALLLVDISLIGTVQSDQSKSGKR